MVTAAVLNRPNAAAGGGGPRDQAPPVPLVPFVRASRERTELADDRSVTITANSQAIGPIDIPASGFLRHLVLQVEATGGSGTATVAAQSDAPFNVLQDISLSDVNGNPIYGPVTSGYNAYLIQKYGAYDNLTDLKQLPSYSAVATGANASGNFAFTLRIPVEISGRDALGSLANMSAAQTYKLRYTIAPSATVYSTAPTNLPAVRVRIHLETWAQPAASNAFGMAQEQTPPAHGVTQYWSQSTYTINSGDNVIRLTRVGNLVRTIICRLDTTAPARSTTNFPDPIRLEYDGSLVESLSRTWFRDRMAQRYGFIAAADAVGGLDTGIFVWDFTHDLDGKPGWELRDLLLPTTQATRLELRGSFGAAGTLTVFTNDIAVPAGTLVAGVR